MSIKSKMSLSSMSLRRAGLRAKRALNAALLAWARMARPGSASSPHVLDRLRQEQAASARRERLALRQEDFDEAIAILDHAIELAERAKANPLFDV